MALRFSRFSGQVVLALWIWRGAAKSTHRQRRLSYYNHPTNYFAKNLMSLALNNPAEPRVPGWLQKTGLVETIPNVMCSTFTTLSRYCCTKSTFNMSVKESTSGKERDEQLCSYACINFGVRSRSFSSATTRCVT